MVKPEFVKITEEIYLSFSLLIDELRTVEDSKKGEINFKDVVTASYIKTYDFFIHLCNLSDYSTSFYLLPMLRGICEDYISITYLIKMDANSRDLKVQLKFHAEIEKSLKAQKSFLNKTNKYVLDENILNKEYYNDLLKSKPGNANKDLPSVYKMAESIGMKDLYSFLYHASSKTVHFDIFTLLSTGWGEFDDKNITLKTKFSAKNNHRYYFTFVFFYTSYLFILQSESYKGLLKLPSELNVVLSTLLDKYTGIEWPEIITHSHMNIKSKKD